MNHLSVNFDHKMIHFVRQNSAISHQTTCKTCQTNVHDVCFVGILFFVFLIFDLYDVVLSNISLSLLCLYYVSISKSVYCLYYAFGIPLRFTFSIISIAT